MRIYENVSHRFMTKLIQSAFLAADRDEIDRTETSSEMRTVIKLFAPLHARDLNYSGSWACHLDDRQRKSKLQFVFEINLNVVQSVLLKLHAAKVMHVRGVTFHLFQHELDFRLRDHLLFIYANDARFLPKFSRATAPAAPDTQTHVIDRQRGRRDHAEYTDEGLHAIDLAPHILANDGALQVRKNRVRFHR